MQSNEGGDSVLQTTDNVLLSSYQSLVLLAAF